MTGPRPVQPPDAAGAGAGAAGPAESPYWLKTRRLTGGLLLAWFGLTFLSAFFARDIDVVLLGWPFSFWFAAQGALLLFLAIVGVYAWRMERLEDEMAAEPSAGPGAAAAAGDQPGGFSQGSDSARIR